LNVSDCLHAATIKVKNAPTDEASTGVKKPVYIPPIVRNTTARIGKERVRDFHLSFLVARFPGGPAEGFFKTVK